MDIYTAQYRYAGPDRVDITVKGNPGHVLAPSWEIVRGLQAHKINEWDYTIAYYSLLINRLRSIDDAWRLALDHVSEYSTLTLVCFCAPQTFCHRILAARLLENLGFGKYHGERIIS